MEAILLQSLLHPGTSPSGREDAQQINEHFESIFLSADYIEHPETERRGLDSVEP